MKKLIALFSICFSLIMIFASIASAAEIVIYAPTESEIMPMRDFYIIGAVDRNGQSSSSLPLNIKIELLDKKGTVIRSLESNVGRSGTTPAEYFLIDYEQGTAFNDSKGAGLNLLTPPDIIFDGNDRNSILSAKNKIVVKEDYFAAIIYGGATKDFELDYFDDQQKPLKDITEGEYTLTITAYTLDGIEFCKKECKLNFGNTMGRVIFSDNQLITDYANENKLSVTNSVVGMWNPSDYFKASKDFSYLVSKRYSDNLELEFGNAKNINVFLYNLDTKSSSISQMLTSAYKNPAKKTYLYFDIGEKDYTFNFGGSILTNKGNIVSNKEDCFIEILRSETFNDDNIYADFNSKDGFVLTKGNKTMFIGVFSPMIEVSSSDEGISKFSDKTAFIKYTLSDQKNNILLESYTDPYTTKGEDNALSRYEFNFEITPDSKITKANPAFLTLSLCNSDKEEIFKAEPINIRINPKGDFIGNYDDAYWGKSFCDIINALGQTPAEEYLDADEFITRGDFSSIINRLFGYSIASDKAFSDLDEKSVYFNDCATAQAVGYMTGDHEGRVQANDFISREQAMIILSRISKAKLGEKSVTFKDSDEVSFWAKEHVDIMTSNGIVSGFDGYLHPKDSITVAEAAALVIKTYKWIYQGEIKNSDIITTPPEEEIKNDSLSDIEFISDVNYESVSAFLLANSETINSLTKHFVNNYKDGIFINRVGNGLEIRDYRLGSYISLPSDVLDVTTIISEKFAEFSIRYNPKSEDAVHIILGRDDNGKQIGLTYTTLEESKNKTLTHIDGNWYYHTQK